MIKFFLHQEDGKTYFAVLEMDEKQRRPRYGDNLERMMSNGIKIMSIINPELDPSSDIILLRGSDLDLDMHVSVTMDECDTEPLIEALREWATTGGFFPEEAKPAQTSFSQSVFSF